MNVETVDVSIRMSKTLGNSVRFVDFKWSKYIVLYGKVELQR